MGEGCKRGARNLGSLSRHPIRFASKMKLYAAGSDRQERSPSVAAKFAAKLLRLEREIRSAISEGPENSSGHEGRMQCCRSIQFALGVPCRCEAGMDMVSVWAFRGSIPSIDNRD